MVDTDLDFIVGSWLSSSKNTGDNAIIPHDVFATHKRKEIVNVLNREHVKVYVCELEETLVGFGVFEDNHIHFLYTKFGYRRQHVGLMLVAYVYGPTPKNLTTSALPHKVKLLEDFKIIYNPWEKEQ
jgi:hypothetical protein